MQNAKLQVKIEFFCYIIQTFCYNNAIRNNKLKFNALLHYSQFIANCIHYVGIRCTYYLNTKISKLLIE